MTGENKIDGDIWIRRERLESMAKIDRRIREIRNARKSIRDNRKMFNQLSDEQSRQLTRSEIIRTLIEIEISAESLAREAKRIAINEAR